MRKVNREYFLQDDVVFIARDLIGKYLYTEFGHGKCGGIITETEAYRGVTDKASHAYGNRYTARTEVMYRQGGLAYVYLCYGIHSLFNIVTAAEGTPHAVLIRGIYPQTGIDLMKERTAKEKITYRQTNGPGKLSKALGIHYSHSGMQLNDTIWLEESNYKPQSDEIVATPRIGVDYAEEDSLLPYRFLLKDIKKSLT